MRRGVLPLAAVLVVAAVAAHPPGLLSPVNRPMATASVGGFPTMAQVSRNLLPVTAVHAQQPVADGARVVMSVKTSQRVVALTFDLDMTPSMLAEVRAGTSWFNTDALSYLRAQDVHATFFMTGLWAEVYPSLARQLAEDRSFEVANHSYSHPAFHLPCYRLGGVGRAAQAKQIQMAQQSITWVTGVTPRYFRFPGGCYDRQALDLVHAAGLIPIQWDVNSIDAFNAHPEQISATVLSGVKPGSIVIMHLQAGANAPATGGALRRIVPALKQRGYKFVTVGELLKAGSPIQPTDPKEVVEVYQPPLPTATPWIAPRPVVTPRPRWCGWVYTRTGRVWACQ